MKNLITIFSVILIFGTLACKQSKEASSSTNTEHIEKEASLDPDSFPAQSRLVVTFFSIASGTDYKATVRFEDFIGEYAGEIGKTVDYEKTHWGREGETDFCLELTELDTEQQADFVRRTRKLLETAEHVNIYENSPCKHRRKRE